MRIPPRHKPPICVAVLLVAAGLALAPAAASAAPGKPTPLRSASFKQHVKKMVLTVQSERKWSIDSMRRDGGDVCLQLSQNKKPRRVCFTRGAKRPILRLMREHGKGKRVARIHRPNGHTAKATFPPRRIGLKVGGYHWRVIASASPRRCDRHCKVKVPAKRAFGRLKKVRVVGCRAHEPVFNTSGSRAHKVVALTFDDGPSAYTSRFLDVLKDKHVNATFFLIGEQVAGNGALLRRMLAEGNMIGDHTWNHQDISGGGSHASWEITSARDAIRRATGFETCMVRAPYGAVGPGLFAVARSLGVSLIQWDVDPNDWQLPGTDAIYSRIVSGVRNGSITLSHDGGGDRSETLAALPRIIDTLRGRGYKFVTVPELLGYKLRYGT